MPGCYVVMNGGSAVYIGRADRVKVRVTRGHRVRMHKEGVAESPWGPLHEFVLKVKYDTRYGESLMREARLIRKIRPSRNVVGIPRKRRPRISYISPNEYPTIEEAKDFLAGLD